MAVKAEVSKLVQRGISSSEINNFFHDVSKCKRAFFELREKYFLKASCAKENKTNLDLINCMFWAIYFLCNYETAWCYDLVDFSVKLAKFITSSCFIIIYILKYKHVSWKDQVHLFSQFVFIHLCLTQL